jgi:capsule polysaccharide export protein KpsE/RkpR
VEKQVQAAEPLIWDPETLANTKTPGSLYYTSAKVLRWAHIIWNRRRFFLKWFGIAVAVSILLVFLIPKYYEATAVLMPPDDSSLTILGMLMGSADEGTTGGGAASSAGGAVGDLLGLKSTGQLYVQAATSRTLTDRMIQRFHLMERYNCRFIEDCRKKWDNYFDVVEKKKSGTIEITVTDKDPQLAAQMANAAVEELNRLMIEINTADARQEREVTEQRVAQAQQELEVATRGLAEFASKNTTIEPDEQAKAAVEISAAIEGELIAAESDLKGMEKLYTPNNQRVYSARARVAELQNQLAKANSGGVRGDVKEGDLPSVRELPLLGTEYLDLYRKVKVREEVLKVLTKEYELARIRENHQVATVSVMDQAVVPTKKSFPPRTLFVLGLALLGFFAVATCTVLIDWWEAATEQDPWKALLGPYLSRVRLRRYVKKNQRVESQTELSQS